MSNSGRITHFMAAPGAGFSAELAQTYGTYLQDEVGLGKRVVPSEEIVEAARPEASPLHGEFTWDDAEAAVICRLAEARRLVNHIVIVTQSEDGNTARRAFHNVIITSQGKPQRGYIAERLVWRQPELAEQVMERARRELLIWRERYATYSGLAGTIAKIDDILGEDLGEAA